MLIICNGVFKSGSSWLHAITIEILKSRNIIPSEIDERYTNNIDSPTPIIESKFWEFLVNEDYDNNYYINKSHFFKNNTINRKYPDSVVFLFSERNIKDSIVSHFFHLKNKYSFIRNFSVYYWTIGRLKSYEIVLFNQKYKKAFNKENFIHFSDLKTDFDKSAQRIAKVLKLNPLTDDELLVIKEKTSIANMRDDIARGKTKYYSTVKKGRVKLLREGNIDNYKQFFSNRKLNDISRIDKFNTSLVFKFLYYITFRLRRNLFSIE